MSAKSIQILDYQCRRMLIETAKRSGRDVTEYLAEAGLKGEPVKGAPAEATLRDDLVPADLIRAEAQWGTERSALLERCRLSGVPTEDWPKHWRWNWADKAEFLQLLAYRSYGIFVGGQWQGMMMTTNAQHETKLDPDVGKPLIYLEFVEVAPWNLQKVLERVNDHARYGAVGSCLIAAAIQLSYDEGFHGRIGLHSLKQAEEFYTKCGMTLLGKEYEKHTMKYFEMTREQAAAYLKRGA